jgi:glycerol-3-phosphate dehydrogenase
MNFEIFSSCCCDDAIVVAALIVFSPMKHYNNRMHLSDSTTTVYSIAIIGGGVVGLAVFRALATRGIQNVILLEKNNDIVGGASSGNSGIFHTGFDAPPDSIEYQCMKLGHIQLMNILSNYSNIVPIQKVGALVVAWNEMELQQLQSVMDKSKKNQVECQWVDQDELRIREPHLSHDALAAVFVPDECIVDPWILPLFYLHQALSAGAQIRTNFNVQSGIFDSENNYWQLVSSNSEQSIVKASIVINCAGNYGDIVNQIVQDTTMDFRIVPRKGQFAVYGSDASSLVKSIILPVPTERTKGVLVSNTVFGNIIVGPTAEDQQEREIATVDPSVINSLIQKGSQIIPDLNNYSIVGTYAGLRPATQYQDYQIGVNNNKRWITVAGIRSTGLTASAGIGEYVWRLLNESSIFNNQQQQQQMEWYPFTVEYLNNHQVIVNGNRTHECYHKLVNIGWNNNKKK